MTSDIENIKKKWTKVQVYGNIREKAAAAYADAKKNGKTKVNLSFTKDELFYIANMAATESMVYGREIKDQIKQLEKDLEELKKMTGVET